MIKRFQKGLTLMVLILIVLVLGILATLWPTLTHDSYPMRARVMELVLAPTSAKMALTDGIQRHHSWSATWMSSITISATGAVASATISPVGQIIVYGTPFTSNAIVTMTPTITNGSELVWTCSGSPEKYMPAPCRRYK